MEDEDDDNEDDVETGRDVKNIEAHLPYTSNLSVPNDRKFCDVTFSHGQGVGALLENDDVTDNVTMERTSTAMEQAQEEETITEFSIDEYSSLCMEHLNFTENDVLFVRILYETISQAEAMGISMPCLKQVRKAYSKCCIPLLLIAN